MTMTTTEAPVSLSVSTGDTTWQSIQLYTSGVALVIGVPANCLVLVMLRGPYFRRTSTGMLLLAITLFDLGFLVTVALRWLIQALTDGEQDIAGFGLPGCMLFTHLSHVFDHLSYWLLILVVLERVMTIRRTPAAIWVMRNLHRLALIGGLLTLLFNVHWYWNIADMTTEHTQDVDKFWCPLPLYPYLENSWFWADLLFGEVAPIFFILMVSSVLVATISLKVARRRQIIHSNSVNNFTNFERLVTAMSLGLSALYLVSNIPIMVFKLGVAVDAWSGPNIYTTWSACYAAKFIYSSFKLFLYIAISHKIKTGSHTQVLCCNLNDTEKQPGHDVNSGESDQHASKGLSTSAQSSMRSKGEKLKELLSYLEKGPVEQLADILSIMQSLDTKPDQQNKTNGSEKATEGDEPGKPRKKRLSSSRSRKWKNSRSSTVDSDNDSVQADDTLSVHSGGGPSRGASFKRKLTTVLSVPMQMGDELKQTDEGKQTQDKEQAGDKQPPDDKQAQDDEKTSQKRAKNGGILRRGPSFKQTVKSLAPLLGASNESNPIQDNNTHDSRDTKQGDGNEQTCDDKEAHDDKHTQDDEQRKEDQIMHDNGEKEISRGRGTSFKKLVRTLTPVLKTSTKSDNEQKQKDEGRQTQDGKEAHDTKETDDDQQMPSDKQGHADNGTEGDEQIENNQKEPTDSDKKMPPKRAPSFRKTVRSLTPVLTASNSMDKDQKQTKESEDEKRTQDSKQTDDDQQTGDNKQTQGDDQKILDEEELNNVDCREIPPVSD